MNIEARFSQKKENQNKSCSDRFHGTCIFLLPVKVSSVKVLHSQVHQGNLFLQLDYTELCFTGLHELILRVSAGHSSICASISLCKH